MAGVCGLDLGLDTGWGLETGTGILCGEFSIRHLKGLGPRFATFDRWLFAFLRDCQPERVIFEAPIPRGNKLGLAVPRITFGLSGLVEKVCYESRVSCSEATPSEVKKFFTGHGRAEKEDMIAECRRRGWDPPTDNAADGCAVMAYGVALFHGKSPERMGRAGNELVLRA